MTAQSGIFSLGGFEHIEAGAFVDVDIGEDDGVGLFAEALDGVAGGGGGVDGVALRFERGLDGELEVQVVFD